MTHLWERIESARAYLIERKFAAAAYASTLYFIEILILMFSLVFLYGKAVAAAVGISLSAALAYHTIQLYFMKKRHRVLHCFLIDLHAAFAAAYLAAAVIRGASGEGAIIAARCVILAVELPVLLLLTQGERHGGRVSGAP